MISTIVLWVSLCQKHGKYMKKQKEIESELCFFFGDVKMKAKQSEIFGFSPS